MKGFKTIVGKELSRVLKDKKMVFSMFILPIILVVGIISFAFSTIIGWYYYGERCIEYLGGKKAISVYRVIYVAVAIIAPVISLNFMWLITDTLNALMAIPNLIAVLILSPVVVSETKKYINNINKKDDREIPVVKL